MKRYLLLTLFILLFLPACTKKVIVQVPQKLTTGNGEALGEEPDDGFYTAQIRRGHKNAKMALDIFELGLEAGRFIQASSEIEGVIMSRQDELKRQCGSRVNECKKGIHKMLLARWAQYSGFSDRMKNLEEARMALDIIEERLKDPDTFTLEEASALCKIVVKALIIEGQILLDHGVPLPQSVKTAVEDLSFFARLTLV